MLRAYIVDDERLAVERLTRLLEATGRVRVAGSTTIPRRRSQSCASALSMSCFSTSRCPD